MDSYEDIEFYNRIASEGYSYYFDVNFKGLHIKKYSFLSSIKESFLRFKNSLVFKSKYKNIFRLKTIDKYTKLFFLSKSNLIILLCFYFTSIISLKFLLFFIFLIIIFDFFLQNKIFNKIKLDFFVFSYFYSLSLFIVLLLCYSTTKINILLKSFNIFLKNKFEYFLILLKIYLKSSGPIQIIHYVTSRCNLRCSHCFYKDTLDKKDPGEQELSVFNQATKNMGPVLWYALAGGEVFIRKDVSSIIEIILKNTNAKYISIPSNGWYTSRMFNSVLEILRNNPNLLFSIYFSIDGFPKIHNEIRGENSYEKLYQSFKKLEKLKKYYKNFKTNIVTTITEQNCKNTDELISFLHNEFNPDNISINLFRYHSYEHPPLPDEVINGYDIAYNKYFEIKKTLKEKSIFKGLISKIFIVKDIIQKFIIINVARHNQYVTPCTAGKLSFVIMEDGKVKPCEILDDSYGNIYDNDFLKIINSDQAKISREKIISTKCKCTYECAMSTNALFSWPMTKKFITKFFKYNFQ